MKGVDEWNEATVFALLPYKRILSSVGSWPFDLHGTQSVAIWLAVLFIHISLFATMSLEIQRHCQGADAEVETFAVDVFAIVGILKHLINRLDWRRRAALFESAIADWSSTSAPADRAIMIEYARKGRFVLECFLGMFGASIVALFVQRIPLTLMLERGRQTNASHARPFLVETYCVYGAPPIVTYVSLLLVQVVQLLAGVLVHCGLDATFFGLLMHLCGQFEVLKRKFGEVRGRDHGRRLGALVERHCRLAEIADDLEDAFSAFILVQVLTSAFLLCVEAFQLIMTLNDGDRMTAAKHGIFIATVLIQIYLYAFAGNTLELVTGGLVHSIYGAPWYDFERSAMRAMPMIIMRASKPHRTTAGKFIVMNHDSFKEILKASISYISLLRVLIKFN